MASSSIKQFVVVRRRAGQTVKAFHDYHYQRHGAISQAGKAEESPTQYYQTHFFDTVYSNSKPAQPAYAGHNDSTELYFDDADHMKRVYSSAYVREKVGPDGVNFNDFAATIAMFARETSIFTAGPDEPFNADSQAITATYWLQTSPTDASSIIEKLNDRIKAAFGGVAVKIVCNLSLPDPEGMLKYFQGDEAPSYSVAYQVVLPDAASVDNFEKAREALEKSSFKDLVDTNTTFVVFGVRSLLFGQSKGIRFDPSRQPRLPYDNP